jgi:hypothetical protein
VRQIERQTEPVSPETAEFSEADENVLEQLRRGLRGKVRLLDDPDPNTITGCGTISRVSRRAASIVSTRTPIHRLGNLAMN